jgi:predicted P-loop ATPase
VESCYEPDLARLFALAELSNAQASIEASALEDRLRKTFGKELNLTRLRKSVRLIREEIVGSAVQPDGPNGYIRTSEGAIRPILANAITALNSIDLAFDTFQQRVVLREESPWGTIGQWTDDDDLHGTEHLQRTGILVENLRTTNGAARRLALKNQFHPVRDWLESLEWDRKSRLDFWLNTYLGVEETELTLDFARMWMISAVARIFEPGCKADCMLVLESKQGVRKSSALRMLVNGHLDAGKEPFWFRDRIPTLSSDDVGLHMQGVWVIEIAELDAIRRSAAWTATKNFISDQSDTFRRKYGINLQDYPRQCVFAGSTNEKEWMGDSTGGRRFWAVNVNSVDLEGIRNDREQLWAEAVHFYKSRSPWHLSDEQEEAAKNEIESRMPEDVWHDKVSAAVEQLSVLAVDDDRSVSIPSILESLKIETGRQGQAEQNRVARVLRSLGYVKFRTSATGGRRQWRYRKTSDAPSELTP